MYKYIYIYAFVLRRSSALSSLLACRTHPIITYIHVYLYICIPYINLYIYIYMYISMCECMNIYTCICSEVQQRAVELARVSNAPYYYLNTCISIYICEPYINIYICISICIYLCEDVYIYIYMHLC